MYTELPYSSFGLWCERRLDIICYKIRSNIWFIGSCFTHFSLWKGSYPPFVWDYHNSPFLFNRSKKNLSYCLIYSYYHIRIIVGNSFGKSFKKCIAKILLEIQLQWRTKETSVKFRWLRVSYCHLSFLFSIRHVLISPKPHTGAPNVFLSPWE